MVPHPKISLSFTGYLFIIWFVREKRRKIQQKVDATSALDYLPAWVFIPNVTNGYQGG